MQPWRVACGSRRDQLWFSVASACPSSLTGKTPAPAPPGGWRPRTERGKLRALTRTAGQRTHRLGRSVVCPQCVLSIAGSVELAFDQVARRRSRRSGWRSTGRCRGVRGANPPGRASTRPSRPTEGSGAPRVVPRGAAGRQAVAASLRFGGADRACEAPDRRDLGVPRQACVVAIPRAGSLQHEDVRGFHPSGARTRAGWVRITGRVGIAARRGAGARPAWPPCPYSRRASTSRTTCGRRSRSAAWSIRCRQPQAREPVLPASRASPLAVSHCRATMLVSHAFEGGVLRDRVVPVISRRLAVIAMARIHEPKAGGCAPQGRIAACQLGDRRRVSPWPVGARCAAAQRHIVRARGRSRRFMLGRPRPRVRPAVGPCGDAGCVTPARRRPRGSTSCRRSSSALRRVAGR